MTVVNYYKNRVALLIGGSITENPDYFIIGTGSSTVTSSDTELVSASDRQEATSTSYPSLYKTKFQGDWSTTEMSGTTLSEFGLVTSGTGVTGSIWTRTVIPSIEFDGTNELRIEETTEIY